MCGLLCCAFISYVIIINVVVVVIARLKDSQTKMHGGLVLGWWWGTRRLYIYICAPGHNRKPDIKYYKFMRDQSSLYKFVWLSVNVQQTVDWVCALYTKTWVLLQDTQRSRSNKTRLEWKLRKISADSRVCVVFGSVLCEMCLPGPEMAVVFFLCAVLWVQTERVFISSIIRRMCNCALMIQASMEYVHVVQIRFMGKGKTI